MLYAFGVTVAIVAGVILTPFLLSIGAAMLIEGIERFEDWNSRRKNKG